MINYCKVVGCLLFAVSVLCHGALAQEKNDLSSKGLLGRVDSVTETDFVNKKVEEIDNAVAQGPHSSHKMDANGNEVELKYYDKGGTLVFQYFFAWDSVNNLKAKLFENVDNFPVNRWDYHLDQYGFLTSITVTDRNEVKKTDTILPKVFLEKKVYLYDTFGRLTETKTLTENNNVVKVVHHHGAADNTGKEAGRLPTDKYDDNGKITERAVLNEDGTEKGKIYYKYDGAGNELEQDYYRQSDQFKTILTMNEYDQRGHILSRTMNRIDGGHGDKFVYKYDEQGNRIEFSVYLWKESYHLYKVERYNATGAVTEKESYDENGSFESKIVNRYNTRGDLIKTQTLDKDESIVAETVYSYKDFDEKGNWHTRCCWKQDNNQVRITTREITYFPGK